MQRDQMPSSLEGRGHRGNLETRSPSPSGGPGSQSLHPHEQDPASRRENCPLSRAHHKGQLENGCLWTEGLLPQKASPPVSPGGRRMDQMASPESRPQILEDSLTLHTETCPLRTTGTTVQSGEGQTERVCAPGTRLPQPSPEEAAACVLKNCLSSWFANKIQLPEGYMESPLQISPQLSGKHLGKKCPWTVNTVDGMCTSLIPCLQHLAQCLAHSACQTHTSPAKG